MIQLNEQNLSQSQQSLQIIRNSHLTLEENRQQMNNKNWRVALYFELTIMILILIYSIQSENTKQIESPFNDDGQQCGLDKEVIDCPYQMQQMNNNKTSNICVKQCPDINGFTYDCLQNQITTKVKLNLVDNICVQEYNYLSSFKYFNKNTVYWPMIVVACIISYFFSNWQFVKLLKNYQSAQQKNCCFLVLSFIAIFAWISYIKQNIIESEQFIIMKYIIIYSFIYMILYQIRACINLCWQMNTFNSLFEGFDKLCNFNQIFKFQLLLLTPAILFTYINLNYITYIGRGIQNSEGQISNIEYSYQYYSFVIICFYSLKFNIFFILGIGKLSGGISIFQTYFGLDQTTEIGKISIIYKYHTGQVALNALLQTFTWLPLILLQLIQYVFDFLQFWIKKELRISIDNIISYFRYCDDRSYFILAYTGLPIRQVQNLLITIRQEYKFNQFYDGLSYNQLIASTNMLSNGIISLIIILSILLGIDIKLYAQYIQFFWYILMTSFIISNSILTYIQYLTNSIIMLIIIDNPQEQEKKDLPQRIQKFHKVCNLRRKIYEQDTLISELNRNYINLKQQQLTRQNENPEIQIQELKTQLFLQNEQKQQLEEEFISLQI